ncbi:MAG: hypothetical protein IE927_01585 [Rhodobacterales bacterium]|nr:hypothetical protein [Rhodobacterales bacterium]
MTTITTTGTTTDTGMADRPQDRDDFEFWRHARWWRAWFRLGFGPMFFVLLGVSVVSGAAVWWLKGEAVFRQALSDDLAVLLGTMPRVIAAVAAAGVLWVLIPRERVAGIVGRGSGVLGLVAATFAGTVTVGGPTAAFPLLAILGSVGADRGVMVAFITAWATLGLQRILTWDVPMMGLDFSILRFAATMALPVVAGLIARALPIDMVLKAETRLRDRM